MGHYLTTDWFGLKNVGEREQYILYKHDKLVVGDWLALPVKKETVSAGQ